MAEGGGVEPRALTRPRVSNPVANHLAAPSIAERKRIELSDPLQDRRISSPVQKTNICVLSMWEIETHLAEEVRIELTPL